MGKHFLTSQNILYRCFILEDAIPMNQAMEQATGASRSTWYKWIEGERACPPEMIIKLYEWLHTLPRGEYPKAWSVGIPLLKTIFTPFRNKPKPDCLLETVCEELMEDVSIISEVEKRWSEVKRQGCATAADFRWFDEQTCRMDQAFRASIAKIILEASQLNSSRDARVIGMKQSCK